MHLSAFDALDAWRQNKRPFDEADVNSCIKKALGNLHGSNLKAVVEKELIHWLEAYCKVSGARFK